MQTKYLKTAAWIGVLAAGMASTVFAANVSESARPGENFFYKGVAAIGKEDYKNAVSMYVVAASWAYKPAQYNLGVMYYKGEGVPMDRARGLAWLALAAERGDEDYVSARDRAYTDMSDEEFAQANVLWRDLRKTYGDEVALRRAKNRWRQTLTESTGSHLGTGAGPVSVGGKDRSGMNVVSNPDRPADKPSANSSTQNAFGITGPGAIDGSIAYRELRESDDPYDPKFKKVTGEAKVLDIIPIGESVRREPTAGSKPPTFY